MDLFVWMFEPDVVHIRILAPNSKEQSELSIMTGASFHNQSTLD